MATNGTSNGQSDIKTVGYIGLGNAGFSMASNIPKAGYKLVVHDADPSKVEKATKEWPNTIASHGKPEAFKDCKVIVTMLPQGKIVRDVLLGKDNIASALQPGTIIIDTSSSSPFDTQELGKELAKHQLQLLDSPITQTYMHATDLGASTLMVGSDSRETFELAEPILRCMGDYIFHMGKLGNGHAMKTLNNYIMASSLCALSDSLVTGQKYGLDAQQIIDVLNVGTGVNFPVMDPIRRDGITGRYNSGFGLALLIKDLGITQEFMDHNRFGENDQNGTALPGVLRNYLQQALDEVEPMADHSKCLVGWEKRSGVTLKKTAKVEDIPQKDFDHRLAGLNRKN